MTESTTRRLVFIVASFEPDLGGDVRLVANQARALAERGWDVTVLTRRPDGRVPREERLNGIRVVRRGRRTSRRRDLASALLGWTLWLVRRRRSVFAVHAVMHPDYLLPVFASRLLDRAVLQWITDGDVERSLGSRGGGLRSAQIRARRWLTARVANVSLTDRMRRELTEVGISPGEVIPLGVDTARLQAPDRQRRSAERVARGIAPSDVVILFVGHLETRKRVDVLLRAVAQLPEPDPWRLWLVGGDHPGESHRRDLEQLSAELGIQARVSFVGAVQDVESYLRIADLFAIASDREGLPNVLLEAMAYGLPCVAPLTAGGGELLDDGAGSVPQTNRPEEIASALHGLISAPELRERVGHRARVAVERFSLTSVADSYERVYLHLDAQG